MSSTNQRLYFAYGSNMDDEQMCRRCPGTGAVVMGTAKLAGHRFVIFQRGYATVVPDPSSSVCGVLWKITPDCEKALDHYEGVGFGLYRRQCVIVETETLGSVDALVYVASDNTPGRPRNGYMERIVAAARNHGLSAPYIEELAASLLRG